MILRSAFMRKRLWLLREMLELSNEKSHGRLLCLQCLPLLDLLLGPRSLTLTRQTRDHQIDEMSPALNVSKLSELANSIDCSE